MRRLMYVLLLWRVCGKDPQGGCLFRRVLWRNYLVLYSFGLSMFSPRWARLWNRWVQFFSTLFLMVTACLLQGPFLMNSSTPCWFVPEKCLPIVFSCLELLLSSKCPANLSLSLKSVWPTYYSKHCLRVIAYMRLELLHEIFCMRCMRCKICIPVGYKTGKPLSCWVVLL